MKYVLDTDTCVFWLRGRTQIRERVAEVGLETISISVITLAELRYGANCSAQSDANHRAIDDFVSGIAVIGVDQEIVRAFADMKAELRKRGTLLEDFDLLVAATARACGLTLVTNNTEHFQRVSGIALENWM